MSVGRGSLLALLPAATVVLVLMAGGTAIPLFEALRDPDAGMSLEAFQTVFREPGFVTSLGLTIRVSVISTLLTLAGAVITAFALRRVGRLRRLLMSVYQLPLTVPHLVLAVVAVTLLSQSGLASRLATAAGLIADPSGFPELVFDRGGVAIVLVYVWKQIPFVGLFALAVLQATGEDYEAAARTLGARPSQVVRHVLLPLVLPALVPAGIIVFAFVFGAFEVPLLLGARYPSMLSVLAYRLYTDTDLTMRPQAMALSFVVALIVFLLVGLYRLAVRERSA